MNIAYTQTGNQENDKSTFTLPTIPFPDPNNAIYTDLAAYKAAYNQYKTNTTALFTELKKWHLGLENKGEINHDISILPVDEGASGNTEAQRSKKIKFNFKADNGLGTIEKFYCTMGNADFLGQFISGQESADLTQGDGLAMKTAIEKIAAHKKSGLPATLESITIVN